MIFAEPGLKAQHRFFFEELEEKYGTVQTLQAIDSYLGFPKVVFYQNSNIVFQKDIKDLLYIEIKGQNLSFGLESQKKYRNHIQLRPSTSAESLHLLFTNFFSDYLGDCHERLKNDSQIMLKAFKKSLRDFKVSKKLEEDISSLEAYVWDFFNLKDAVIDLSKKTSRYFEYIKLTSYFEHLKSLGDGDFIWLASFENKEWGLSFKMRESELEARYIILQLTELLLFIYDFLFINEKKYAGIEKINPLIDKPFAVLSNKHELVLYNDEFKELNLSVKKLLEIRVGEKVESNQKNWVLKKETFDFHKEQFLFYLFEELPNFLEKASLPSSQELGIITSSIAHELNNPLAGVLAAIEVIGLDVEDEYILLEIQEMKKTVIRCKKLVETFLGFSRANTGLASLSNMTILESFEQAIDLIRFRLIEANLKLAHTKKIHSELTADFNFSIMTMLFYIILGEVVTVLGHQKLVQNDSFSQLEIEISVSQKKVELEFKHIKLGLESLEKSKLFIHLTENLNCKVLFKDKGLVLNL